jgi:hypothetical protein
MVRWNRSKGGAWRALYSAEFFWPRRLGGDAEPGQHSGHLPPLLEAAHLQRRLGRPGETVRSVGAAVGKSHAYVQQRLDLLRMIPEF